MFLQPDPGPRPPGFDQLARSVELKRQQLERDIGDYIEHRRHELRTYEQELLAQHRSMECVEDHAASVAASPAVTATPSATAPPAPSSTPDATKLEPEEKAKRTKHSRVQKREKELYGLVTPVFLPLLDARDSPPQHEKKKKPPTSDTPGEAAGRAPAEHATPTGDGDKRPDGRKSRREHTAMEDSMAAEPGKEPADVVKKAKRASSTPTTTKKSALRTHSATKPRRKRVSLVIDGHTVLPADTVAEPALTSTSSEVTSASNSTASLDDMIDPRLISPTQSRDPHIHTETVHHSMPLPMSNIIHSPTKPLIDNTPLSPITQPFITPAPLLPALPSPDPIATEEEQEPHFDTYVGGLRGSGADDVDQAGSYGYPSSLGASYLESYMQSRPLRVRMEAVEKAGLEGMEKEGMVKGRREEKKGEDKTAVEEDVEDDRRIGAAAADEDEDMDMDMDIMGEMEGF